MNADEWAAREAALNDAEWQAQTGNRWFQDLLTVDEVAAIFGVTGRTVRNWCDRGLIEHAWKPTPRSAWLIPAAALDGFTPPKPGWKKGRPRK